MKSITIVNILSGIVAIVWVTLSVHAYLQVSERNFKSVVNIEQRVKEQKEAYKNFQQARDLLKSNELSQEHVAIVGLDMLLHLRKVCKYEKFPVNYDIRGAIHLSDWPLEGQRKYLENLSKQAEICLEHSIQ